MPSKKIRIALVAFAILLTAILLTTHFPSSGVFRALSYNPSRFAEFAEEDLDAIAIALGRYYTATRTYPTTEQGLDALVNRPTAPPVPENWAPKLDSLPLDPWEQPYVYELLTITEFGSTRDQTNLYSLGPDGIESDDDIHASF